MASFTVQTTFTKQKRELAKANALIAEIRAEEVRTQRFDANDVLEMEQRTAYLTSEPTEIASKVLEVVGEVVRQHGARQKANSVSTGRFDFRGIQADLTVPQFRALQDVVPTLKTLVEKLPVENLRRVPNGELDGRPAFFSPFEKKLKTETKYVPYEEDSSTRVRTYEEKYEVLDFKTRTVAIDHGLPAAMIRALKELVDDLSTAIQVGIDEANGKARDEDAVLNDVIQKVLGEFEAQWTDETKK